MDSYYKTKPIINGVKNHIIIEGTIPSLLEGVSVNNSGYRVEYSIDNEHMFVNSRSAGGRNEVVNVVENSNRYSKISNLPSGIYNIYYTTIPNANDYSGRGTPVYKMTRAHSYLIIFPERLKGVKGQKLSTISLPKGWNWVNPDEILTDYSTHAITFTNLNDPISPNKRGVFETSISGGFLLNH